MGAVRFFLFSRLWDLLENGFALKIKFNAFDWLFWECILFRSKLELETQVELTSACVFSFMLGSDWTMARLPVFFFMLSCIKSHGIFFVLADGIYFICNRVIVPHRRRRIPNSQQYASLNHQQIVENNLHSEERSVIEHVIMLLARLPNSCLHWIPGLTDVGYLCYQANAAVERHDMFRYSWSSA